MVKNIDTSYEKTMDEKGRPYRAVVGEDSTGQSHKLRTNTDAQLLVELASSGLKRIRVTMDIDTDWTGGIGAGDILSADDCCTTLGTYWIFPEVGFEEGGYVEIVYARIATQVDNVAPQYNLNLYDTAPTTGSFLSGALNTHPREEDYLKHLGKIHWPTCDATADIASWSEVGPSTIGNLPKGIKCATGSTTLYGVLDTSIAYTHTDNKDITIDLYVLPA